MRFFIGYDPADHLAYCVARASILHHHPGASVTPLVEWRLRRDGYFARPYMVAGTGQCVDGIDGRPFSTQFTYTRFTVPLLCGYQGRAVFMDPDVLVRGDLTPLFEACADRPVAVVKHDHAPSRDTKIIGTEKDQSPYPRKNWSSVVAWNCALQPREFARWVNVKEGRWLHAFGWLGDDDIAELPRAYNWLVGEQDAPAEPVVAHFTGGTPDFVDYAGTGAEWVAAEWSAVAETIKGNAI